MRDEKYLKDFGINFIFDNPAVNVHKEKGQHLAELSDGTFIVESYNQDYDALLLATGCSKLFRKIPGTEGMKNIAALDTRQDHEAIARELRRGLKNVTVVGLNLESLEFVSTLRREYPKVKISVVDDNRENALQTQYGKSTAEALVK